MNQEGYEDILEPRRRDFSNWFWISRSLYPQVAVNIHPKPTPIVHKNNVLKSKKILQLIEEESRNQNVSKEEVKKQLNLILDEIAYHRNLKIVRWMGYVTTKILLKVISGIYVNYEDLFKIKSNMGSCPVIFVPSHRSYADFIMFSYICFHYDISIPAIAAGLDFYDMVGIGEMLRNLGAFFMRRSYNNDKLYWTTFKEYVNQLVQNGNLPIEFFIEGTRSRSNKSIAPKYGLINMMLKSYFLALVPDILFVPVSISYDRILEDQLFGFELLGIPKPRESTSGFFKSLKILKERFGNIYFHFGEPISTKDFLENKLNRTQHSFGPIDLHETSEEEKKVIPPLAYEIVRRQQMSSVVNYFNLIALILNNNLTRGQECTGFQELITEIRILKRTLQSWGATIFEQNIEEAVKECLLVHKNLIHLYENGTIGLVTNKISVGKLDPMKLKGHVLSEDTISYSIPFFLLQIYANPVYHYLIDGALIVIILRSCGKINKDDLFRHFCTLRVIFSYEFILLETWYKMHFEEALLRLITENIIVCKNEEYDIFENNYFEEVLISSIQPFILTYYGVTEILLTLPEVVSEKTILASVQKLMEDAIREKKIFIHPYCMSLDSLGNCLTSFEKMKVVKKNRQDSKNIYTVNTDSIRKVKADLEIYIPSFNVIRSFDIFLHIKSKL